MDVFSEGGEAIVIYLCLFTYTAASIAEEERKGKERKGNGRIDYTIQYERTKDERRKFTWAWTWLYFSNVQ